MALSNPSAFPANVLLHLLGFCELVTMLHSQCKREFWIHALRMERLTRPIACPLHEDLTRHDLQSLKRIALHTLRRERNWSLPEPQVIGSIKSVMLNPRGLGTIIFQVPGTELYVFHSRSTGMVVAWDVGLGKQATPSIYISRLIMDMSPGQDQAGRFSMGLLTSESWDSYEIKSSQIGVVCLEYGPAGVTLSLSFEHTFKAGLSRWAVFMTKEYVGALECDPTVEESDATIDIIALNLSSGNKTLIKTDILRHEFGVNVGHLGTSTADGNMFILVEYKKNSRVYCCPKSYLPHDGNPECPSTSVLKCRKKPALRHAWKQAHPDDELEPEAALSSDDFYGIPAVSLHGIQRPSRTAAWQPKETSKYETRIQIRFWAKPAPDTTKVMPSLIAKHSVDIDGSLQDSPEPDSSWKLMLLPESGRKVLLVVNLNTHLSFQLVNYDPEMDKISVHRLELPHFIDISQIYGFSLDDHRGVITLLDTRGVLFAIPYA
ncbi:hypothetical protein BDZ97DRAFT_2013311 [Flammula alnicola]|nr:hypothetical protein BDZ97DRAFT_2013311 [Flammula alnicola]